MEELKQIQSILSRINFLDEDAKQDVFIKIWERFDQYDSAKSKLTTWVWNVAINHQKDLIRRKNSSTFLVQIPFSKIKEDIFSEYQYADSVASNESSQLDDMIEQERIEHLLKELKKLSKSKQDVVNKYLKADKLDSSEKVTISRVLSNFEFEKETRYVLRNLKTNTDYNIRTYDEAKQITGFSTQLINQSCKKNKLFGENIWSISRI